MANENEKQSTTHFHADLSASQRFRFSSSIQAKMGKDEFHMDKMHGGDMERVEF